MQVMLNRGHAPDTHLVSRLDDLGPFVDDLVIEIGIPTNRAFGAPIMFVFCRKHRIELNDYLGLTHTDLPEKI